jgi:hypothetical protein
MKIPVRIAWDAVPDADRYVVYAQPEGGDFAEIETPETSIVLAVPERRETLVYVTSRQGQLESIGSEEMRLYTARW